MPTYDYACDLCDHRFEEFQSITAKPLKKCPACGKSALKRLIGTGAGMIFKGSGFYITDYRSESYKKAAEAEKPAAPAKTESSSEPKTPAKADSKPAAESKPAKTESKPSKKAK
ncbi:MAG: FmdB family transcriptional regulator [Planctomycetota bacterium]